MLATQKSNRAGMATSSAGIASIIAKTIKNI
jgi:hypothetical protein